MADAVWPVSLPQSPRLSEYRETPPELVLRTQMSAGPEKARRKNTANVRVATFVFDFTQAQWVTFDAFFMSTIAGGALPFTLKRPSTGNLADWRIIGLPQYRPLTPRALGRWVVSFEAELIPGTEASGSTPPPAGDDGGQVVDTEQAPVGSIDDPSGVLIALPSMGPSGEDMVGLSLGGEDQELTIYGAAPPAQEDFIIFDVYLEPSGAPLEGAPVSVSLFDLPDDSTADPGYGGESAEFGGSVDVAIGIS